MVRDGHRLEKPQRCSDSIWSIIESCWVKQPNRRPTFRQLKKALAHVAEELGNDESIRDVGELLNQDLTEDIKSMTLARKKGLPAN